MGRRGLAISRVVISVVVGLGAASLAAAKEEGKIGPGPTVLSEEEKSLVPDPSKGIEKALVLSEETLWDENRYGGMLVSHHTRTKILSPAGRSLADIEIPFNTKSGSVDDWWGRTICPDREIAELPEEKLTRQVVSRAGTNEVVHLKGALPGVEPGCVIDWGYLYKGAGQHTSASWSLLGDLPRREYRWTWVPDLSASPSFRIVNAAGYAITSERAGKGFVVVAKDLPARVEEPLMPPRNTVEPILHLGYQKPDLDFWKDMARTYDDWIDDFCSKKGALRDAIAAMGIPGGATVDQKARIAYDWLSENIRNNLLMSSEQAEAQGKGDRNEKNTAAYVLEHKEGLDNQFDWLFVGLVRALGGVANLVKVPDRSKGVWDPADHDNRQFAATLVAVRAPGDPVEKAVIADPGSGLPYGEVAWPYTATTGLLAIPETETPIQIPPPDSAQNLDRTEMKIDYGDSNATLRMSWTRTLEGQAAYAHIRSLRTMSPQDRKKTVDHLCGASSRFDLSKAETSPIDRLGAKLTFTCEGEYAETGVKAELNQYGFSLAGDWLNTLPDLPSPTRRYPVVFPYPTQARQTIVVTSPSGFRPLDPPSPVTIESAYGSYALKIERTDSGFKADRTLIFTPVHVPAEQYGALRQFFQQVRAGDAVVLRFVRAVGGAS